MNKVFRIIWNNTLGRLVVASEAAQSRGKSGGQRLQVAPTAAIKASPAGVLRPLVVAIGVAAGAVITPAMLASADSEVEAGKNIEVTEGTGGTGQAVYTVATKDDVLFNDLEVTNTALLGALQVTGQATLNGGLDMSSNKISGVANGAVNSSSTDAVNGKQLSNTNTAVAKSGNSTASVLGGNASYDDTTGELTTSNIGGTGKKTVDGAIAAAGAGWKLEANGTGGTETINPDDTATFDAGTNLDVERSGSTITYSTQDQVDFDKVTVGAGSGNITEVTEVGTSVTDGTDSTEYGADGMTIAGGPSVTSGGIDGGDQVIANVADGVADSDAVNFGQLNDVSDTASAGFKLKANGSDQSTVEPNDIVNLKNVDGNIDVSKKASADDVTFDLADNISVDEVEAGASTLDSDGLTISGGPKFTGSGIDADDQKITGVSAGNISDGSKDAVTGGQLFDLEEGLFTDGKGIKYFHANSTEDDSQANGTDSVAIGPTSIADGNSSFAAGFGATTSGAADNGIALGNQANAALESGTAIGNSAQALAENSIALGRETLAIGDNATSIGATGDPITTLSLGDDGTNLTSINGISVTATGTPLAEDGSYDASNGEITAIAGVPVADKQAVNNFLDRLMSGANLASGENSVATGVGTFASGKSSVAVGDRVVAGNQAVGVGSNVVAGEQAVGIGPAATAGTKNSFAGGNGASVVGNASNGVAIGNNAQAGLGANASGNPTGLGAVAIGSDANALMKHDIALGLGAGANSQGNKVQDVENVYIGHQAGADVLDGGHNIALGSQAGKSRADNSDENVAIGTQAGYQQGGRYNIAIGNSAASKDPGAKTKSTITIGRNADTTGNSAVAVGRSALAGADNAVTLGPNSEARTGGSVALGYNSVADESYNDPNTNSYLTNETANYVLSIGAAPEASGSGSAAVTRRITNVAGGRASTDAVNVEQLTETQTQVANVIGDTTVNADGTMAYSGSDGTNTYSTVTQYMNALANGSAGNPGFSDIVRYDGSSKAGISLDSGGTVIHNVASGTSGTDAVNKDQLDGALDNAKPHYFAVNSTDINNYSNDGATGNDSIAIGPAAEAQDNRAVALGKGADAEFVDSIAIGTGSHGNNTNSAAIGLDSRADGESSIALGNSASVETQKTSDDATDGIAIGTQSHVTRIRGTAIGREAQVDAGQGQAFGYQARIHPDAIDSTAIGNNAEINETAERAMAFGKEATVTNGSSDSTAVGTRAKTSATNAYALGADAQSSADSAYAQGNAARASGNRAFALGSKDGDDSTSASNTNAYAVGAGAQSEAINAYAIGAGSQANKKSGSPGNAGRDAFAIGTGALVNEQNAYAMGNTAEATALSAYAVGDSAESSAESAYAMGDTANVSGGDAFALGSSASVNKDKGYAIGYEATSTGESGYAIGNTALSQKADSFAIGSNAGTDGLNAYALGNTAKANGDNAVAFGTDSVSGGENAIAFGYDATTDTTGKNAIAIGTGSTASSENGVALGNGAIASGRNSLSFGTGSKVTGAGSGAFGDPNTVKALGSYAFGNNNAINIGIDNTFVLGNNVTPSQANSVVLGNQSTDRAATTETGVSLNSISYTFAGQGSAGNGVVSVGDARKERQLINVAAGKVSENSTDAINGSQLYATNQAVQRPITFEGDNGSGKAVERTLNTTLNVQGGATGNLTDDNIGVEGNGSDTLELKLVENVDLGDTGSVKTGNSELDNSGLTVGDGTNRTDYGADEVAMSDGAGNTTTINPGKVEIAGSVNTITLDGGAGTIGGLTNTTFDAGNITSGQAATEDQLKQVNNDLVTSGLDFKGNNNPNGAVHRDLGETLNIEGGATTVGAYSDANVKTVADNGKIAIQLADNPEFTSVTAGDSTLNNDGLTVTSGPNSDVKLTNNGLDNGSNTITNVAPGVDGTDAVNVSQLDDTETALTDKGLDFAGNEGGDVHRDLGETLSITGGATTAGDYSGDNLKTVTNPTTGELELQLAASPKFGDVTINDEGKISGVADGENADDVVNVGQLEDVDATANEGWNLTAESANESNVGPGDSIDLSNTDGNLEIAKADTDNDVTFDLADDLTADSLDTGDTTVDGSGVSVGDDVALGDTGLTTGTNGPSVTTGGIDAGDAPITNVAPGQNDSDAVNVSQLDDTETALTDKGLDFAGNEGGDVHRDLGQTLNVTGGADASGNTNITTVADNANGELSIVMSDQPQFGNVTVNTGGDDTIDGLGNTTFDPDNVVDDRAATEGQLDEVNKVASAGWDVTTSDTTATDTSNVAPEAEVDFVSSDDNLNIEHSRDANGDTAIDYQLADDINVASVTAGDSTLDTNGLTVTDGTTTTLVEADNVTSGNVVVDGSQDVVSGLSNTTYDPTADYSSSDQAASEAQLGGLGESLTTKGLDFAGDSGTDVHRDLGQTLNVTGGADASGNTNITTVADNANGELSIVMSDQPQFGNVTVNTGGDDTIDGLGNTTFDPDNVVDDRAATEGQLDDVNAIASAGWDVATSDTTGTNTSNVAPEAEVDFVSSDNNLEIEHSRDANGDTAIDYQLADDINVASVTAGDSTLDTNGLTVTDGTTTTSVGADNVTSGNVVVDGSQDVVSGLSNTTYDPNADYSTSDQAASEAQLGGLGESLTSDGMNFAGDSGTDVHRDLGQTLDIVGGADASGNTNITTVADNANGELSIVMSDQPQFGNVTVNTGGDDTIDGLGNTTFDPDNVVDDRAATEGQLDDVNAVANAGWDVATSDTTAMNTSNVAPEATVDFVSSDNNLEIEHSRDANGDTAIDYQLADDINVASVAAGNSTLDDDGLTITGGPSMTASGGIDANNQKITNVADGDISSGSKDAVNGGQIQAAGDSLVGDVLGGNAKYEDNEFTMSDVGGTGKDTIDEAIGAANSAANAGWDVATSDTTGTNTSNVAPEAEVDFVSSDNNLEIEHSRDANGDTAIDYQLADDINVASVTAGDSTLDTNGLTVTDGTTTTTVGADNVTSGNVVVDGSQDVVSGLSNTTYDPNADYSTSDQAASEAQLGGLGDSLTSDGMNFAGDSGTDVHRDLGQTLDIVGGADASGNTNITTVADNANGELSIVMSDQPQFGNVTVNTGGDDTIDGLGNTTFDPDNVVDDRAATEGQLDDVNAIASAGWDVATSDTTGTTTSNVAPGAEVDFVSSDSNLEIEHSRDANGDTAIDYQLADDINVASVTAGNSTLDDDGLTITGGPSVTKSGGIDAAGNKVTNVADGDINASSSDAINGSQLQAAGDSLASNVLGGDAAYTGNDFAMSDVGGTGEDTIDDAIKSANTAANAGWNVADTNGNSDNIGPNGKVTFDGDSNVTVTESGADDDAKVQVALNDDITVDSVTADSVTTGNSTLDTDGLTVDDGAGNVTEVTTAGTSVTDSTNSTEYGADGMTIAGGPSVTTGGMDAGDLKITNVADGDINASSGDAINGSQLQAAGDSLASNVLGGDAAYTGNDFTMSDVGGTGENTIDDAIKSANTAANAGWNVADTNGNSHNIGPNGKVTFDGDSNVTVTESGADDDAKVQVALNDDIAVDSVTTGNSTLDNDGLTVDDGAGNVTEVTTAGTSVTDSTDSTEYGADGMTIAGGPSVTTGGINAGDLKITNVADGDINASSGDAINGSQLQAAGDSLASNVLGGDAAYTGNDFTMSDVGGTGEDTIDDAIKSANTAANAGWNVADTNGNSNNIGPNGKVTFDGDSNVTVTESGADDDAKVQVALNDDITVDSVTTGDTVMDSSGVQMGDASGNDPSTTVEAGTITLAANPTTGPANEIVVDANSGTIGGLTNTTFDPDSFTSGQAATEDQLGQVYTVANAGWNVSVDGEGALADGSNNVGPDGVVDFTSDDNIVIERDGTDLAFGLADRITLGEGDSAVTVDGENGEVGVGDTIVNGDGVSIGDDVTLGDTGLEIVGGPSVTAGGIDAGDRKITGVADGDVSSSSSDAINGSQLYEVQQVASAGWNLTGSGADQVNIGPKGAVDFQGDSNISVAQTGADDDGQIDIALNDTITLGENDNAITVDGTDGSITTGDTIMDDDGMRVGEDVALNETGLVIEDGPSVTTGGIDAGGMQITNVASGMGGQSLDQISGDDLMNAVNVGDLKQVAGDIGDDVAAAKTVVTEGNNIKVTETEGDNGESVYEVATSDEVKFDKMDVGSVTIDKDNVDKDGNTIIAGVGKGEVSADSTDAVNGSQLHGVKEEIGDINSSLDGGMDFAADEGDDVNRELGDTVAITGDDNITTRTNDGGVEVGLNRDLDVDSVTTGKTTVSNEGVTIEDGPSMTTDGIDAGDMRITNVAPGVDATDAVNVGQMQELNQRFVQEINKVHGRIKDVEDNANAGTASALAAATVPQAWMPGKSMVGVGAGTYEGESAVSVGVSRLSDNGRWVIQGKVTGDSQSNFGAGVGAGWHW